MTETKTHRQKYTEVLKPWLEGNFEDLPHDKYNHKRIIRNPKKMAEIALEYFINAKETNNMFIQLELIQCFGLSNYSSFDKYKTYSVDFKELILMVKNIIQIEYIKMLQDKPFLAAVFILKTNYGWAETTHQIIEDRTIIVDIDNPDEK